LVTTAAKPNQGGFIDKKVFFTLALPLMRDRETVFNPIGAIISGQGDILSAP